MKSLRDFDTETKKLMQLMFPDYAEYIQEDELLQMYQQNPIGFPTDSAIRSHSTILPKVVLWQIKKQRHYFRVLFDAVFQFWPFSFTPFSENLTAEQKTQCLYLMRLLTQKQQKVSLKHFNLQVDIKLSMLQHPLVLVEKSSDIFREIKKAFGNYSDKYWDVSLINVFKFDTTPTNATNKVLLWHGTNSLNVYDILLEGYKSQDELQITNSESCDKALFFADRLEKAINYSCNNKDKFSDAELILLLNEVQLKNCKVLHERPSDLRSAPNGYHSVKIERYHEPIEIYSDEHKASLVTGGKIKGLLDHVLNEFLVFDPTQVKIRYLIHFGRKWAVDGTKELPEPPQKKVRI